MSIQLARAAARQGYRFIIDGQISKNSNWVQSLSFPSDGSAFDLTDLDVLIGFYAQDYITWDQQPTPSVLLSVLGGQITVDDADTISINAVSGDLTGLFQASYLVDIASQDGSGNVTHLAHGSVMVRDEPVVFGAATASEINQTSQKTSTQHNITVPGDLVIADGDIYEIHKINNTSGSAINVYLPDVTLRTFSIRIVDVAGNAGTYNITILPKSGSGQTVMTGAQYVINSDGASFGADPDVVNGNWM